MAANRIRIDTGCGVSHKPVFAGPGIIPVRRAGRLLQRQHYQKKHSHSCSISPAVGEAMTERILHLFSPAIFDPIFLLHNIE
jgi:hypothetical protein